LPRIAKLRGQAGNELVVASGGNLYPLMFQKILEPVVAPGHDWQVVFRLEASRKSWRFMWSPRGRRPGLDAAIRRSIATEFPT